MAVWRTRLRGRPLLACWRTGQTLHRHVQLDLQVKGKWKSWNQQKESTRRGGEETRSAASSITMATANYLSKKGISFHSQSSLNLGQTFVYVAASAACWISNFHGYERDSLSRSAWADKWALESAADWCSLWFKNTTYSLPWLGTGLGDPRTEKYQDPPGVLYVTWDLGIELSNIKENIFLYYLMGFFSLSSQPFKKSVPLAFQTCALPCQVTGV